MALAKAFGAPYIWASDFPENGSFNDVARRSDIPMLATELGGGGGVDAAWVEKGFDGLLNVLAELGIYTQDPEMPTFGRQMQTGSRVETLYAPFDGLFVPALKLEDKVEKGTQAGMFYHVADFSQPPQAIEFKAPGTLITMTNRGMITKGDMLAMDLSATSH